MFSSHFDSDDSDSVYSSCSEDEEEEPEDVKSIVRQCGNEYECELKNGDLVWRTEVDAGLVHWFEMSEPARKKRKKDERDAVKRAEASSSELLMTVDKAAVLSCFLWEIAMCVKPYFTTDERRMSYGRVVKFSCNYAKRLDMKILQRAADQRFGPPLQQLRRALDDCLGNVTLGVRNVIYEYAGLPLIDDEKKPWARLEVRRLRQTSGKNPKLEMALPKRCTEVAKIEKMVPGFTYELYKSLDIDTWWKNYSWHREEGSVASSSSLAVTVARIETAFHALCRPPKVARQLMRTDPWIPDTRVPHSLELAVRVDDNLAAILIVPSDASLTQLSNWIECEVVPNERTGPYDYLYLDGPINHCGEEFSHLNVILWQLHHIGTSSASYDNGDPNDPRTDEKVKGLDWSRARQLHGSFEKLLDYWRDRADDDDLDPTQDHQQHGGPNDYFMPGYSIAEEMFHDYGPRKPRLQFGVNCALVDLLPLPDDLDHLPMRVIMNDTNILRRRLRGGSITLEWSKCPSDFKVTCLRRFPRLPSDTDYPIVKPSKSLPFYLPPL